LAAAAAAVLGLCIGIWRVLQQLWTPIIAEALEPIQRQPRQGNFLAAHYSQFNHPFSTGC
jgi:hypothetical protein